MAECQRASRTNLGKSVTRPMDNNQEPSRAREKVKIGDRRNRRKHLNRNPLQRWLMRRFHERVVRLTHAALTTSGSLNDLPVDTSSPGQPRSESRVLEVGCGEGFVLGYLRSRLPGYPYQGVDFDAAALTDAAQRNPGIPLSVADITALPFADRSFRMVLCLEVLEHLADPVAGLAELGRVADGPLLVSVPNQPFFALSNFMRGKNWGSLGDDPEHVHHWSGSAFVELVRATLYVTRVVYSFPWVMVLAERSHP